MMEKKVLGKGLGALIPERKIEALRREDIVYLKTEEILPNPYQPRQDFRTEELEELVTSIKEKGIIQPVLAKRTARGYELIAGERRLRAAKSLNIKEIPAILREVKDGESLEMALIENIQRQNLNPIEEAKAFKHLMEQFNLTQERIAQVVGKARVSIANTLRLLKLPLEIQEMLRKGMLSFAHGKLLLEVENSQRQLSLARQVLAKGLTVRELDSLIAPSQKIRSKAQKENQGAMPFKAIAEELQQLLGTKVRILSNHNVGVIHIQFYSQEDLERIYQVIKK